MKYIKETIKLWKKGKVSYALDVVTKETDWTEPERTAQVISDAITESDKK